jgi:hypothetical protein
MENVLGAHWALSQAFFAASKTILRTSFGTKHEPKAALKNT